MWYFIKPILGVIIFVTAMIMYVFYGILHIILFFEIAHYNEYFSNHETLAYTFGKIDKHDKNPLQTLKRYLNFDFI